jgi:hypothetical protein
VHDPLGDIVEDLPTKKMLLQKAYRALPPGGAVIVYERLIDDDRRVNAAAVLANLNMLIQPARVVAAGSGRLAPRAAGAVCGAIAADARWDRGSA